MSPRLKLPLAQNTIPEAQLGMMLLNPYTPPPPYGVGRGNMTVTARVQRWGRAHHPGIPNPSSHVAVAGAGTLDRSNTFLPSSECPPQGYRSKGRGGGTPRDNKGPWVPDEAKYKKAKVLPRPFLGCGAFLALPLLVSVLVAGEVAEVGSPRLMGVVSQAHRDLGDPLGTCWSLGGYAVVVSHLHLIPLGQGAAS